MPDLSYASSQRLPAKTPGPQTRLLALGIVLIALGGIYAFIAVAGTIGVIASARGPGSVSLNLVLRATQTLFLFGAMSAALIGIGIGSIRLRRWSRPLALSLAALLLGCGLVVLLLWMLNYFSPTLENPPPVPRNTRSAVQPAFDPYNLIFVVQLILTLAVLPLAILWGFLSERIRELLDQADPRLCWTDRRPIPVLTLAIGLMAAAFIWMLDAMIPQSAMVMTVLVLICCGFVLTSALVYFQYSIGPWLAILFIAALAGLRCYALSTAMLNKPPTVDRWGWTNNNMEFDLQVLSIKAMIAVAICALPPIAYSLYVRRVMLATKLPRPNIVTARTQ